MMTQEKRTGIAYKPLPPELQVVEREKAHLLLEAHTLKAQARFTDAAERFAQAAHQEEQLADWAARQELPDLHYLHAFSALSCWAQAGDPHRALQMSHSLLAVPSLTAPQRRQLEQYQATLEQRWVNWMAQWSQPAFASA
jgi:hypothetical protein